MRVAAGKGKRTGWRRWARASRRHIGNSPRIGLAVLAVLAGVGIWLATLPLHRGSEQRPLAPHPVAPQPAPPHRAVSLAPEPPAKPPAAAVQQPAAEAMFRPPPALPAPQRLEPAWLRFAVPARPAAGRSIVAVVLDDLGLDRARTAAAIRLPGPLTLSFMTYAQDLPQQTEAARRAGHELLLHVPMEAIDRREDPGPHALYTSLSRAAILDRLRWGLDRFSGYVGINNHMGSRFTADARAMAPVMAELQARGLVFLDSRTTARSTGIELAAADDVPHAARDVFLDDDLAPAAIERQLALLERLAKRHGSAVAIGHAHDPTLAALAAWLPTLPAKGLVLEPVSAVVRYQMAQLR